MAINLLIMNKCLFIILLLMTASSCCNLPLIDCYRQHNYISELGQEKHYFVKSDSIGLSVNPKFVSSNITDDESLDIEINLLFEITNKTGKLLQINLDSVEVFCQSSKERYKFSGEIEQTGKLKIKQLDLPQKKSIMAHFLINDPNFRVIQQHDLEIDIKDVELNSMKLKTNPASFKLTIQKSPH